MTTQYWQVNESVVHFEDAEEQVSGVVTIEDCTGRWQKYLAWVAEGNTAQPWQMQPPVIEEQPIVEEPIAEEPVIEDAN